MSGSSRTHDGPVTGDDDNSPVITMHISLGNLLIMCSMIGAVITGVYEGGAIRATLEASITTEREIRAEQNANVIGQLAGLRQDIDGIRLVLMNRRPMGTAQ